MNVPIQFLARAGYASRGAIYLVVGALALMSAAGLGGRTTNARGALLEVLGQPFGRLLLFALVAGLAGFALWRTIQGLADADNHGRSIKALLIRGGHLISALTHAFLAFWAVQLVGAVSSNGGGGNGTMPGGQAALPLVVAAGAVVVGIGVAHMVKGWTARFERYMTFPDSHEMWARPLCRFGLVARGVVWCIVGGFLVYSAVRLNSMEVQGTGDALDLVAGSPYGQWLLALVAAGLFAFGVYSCLEARYRTINS